MLLKMFKVIARKLSKLVMYLTKKEKGGLELPANFEIKWNIILLKNPTCGGLRVLQESEEDWLSFWGGRSNHWHSLILSLCHGSCTEKHPGEQRYWARRLLNNNGNTSASNKTKTPFLIYKIAAFQLRWIWDFDFVNSSNKNINSSPGIGMRSSKYIFYEIFLLPPFIFFLLFHSSGYMDMISIQFIPIPPSTFPVLLVVWYNNIQVIRLFIYFERKGIQKEIRKQITESSSPQCIQAYVDLGSNLTVCLPLQLMCMFLGVSGYPPNLFSTHIFFYIDFVDLVSEHENKC